MNANTLIAFAKANSGAAVAILLMYIYIGKLEARVDDIEQKYEDCNTARTQHSRNDKGAPFNMVRLEAVLQDKPKVIERSPRLKA